VVETTTVRAGNAPIRVLVRILMIKTAAAAPEKPVPVLREAPAVGANQYLRVKIHAITLYVLHNIAVQVKVFVPQIKDAQVTTAARILPVLPEFPAILRQLHLHQLLTNVKICGF